MNRRDFALAACAAMVSLLAPQAARAQERRRAQTPAAPFPYEVEEVRLSSGADNVVLAGALTRPSSAGRAPALLLLGVAGPNDRDLSFAGHAAFAVLADRFTRAGFTVLRLDDRGVGGSGGDWRVASYDVLAADALSAIAYLRGRADVDAGRVGVFGLSEGAAIAMMAAAASPAAFLVLASPPGLSGEASLQLQFEQTLALYGVSGERAAALRQAYSQFIALARGAGDDAQAVGRLEAFLNGPGRDLVPPYNFLPRDAAGQARLFAGAWYQSQLAFDPAPHLRMARAPVLVVGGARDVILPPSQHHAAIRAVKPDAEFTVIDGVGHVLQPTQTGSPMEYARSETTIDPRVLDVVEGWLRRVAGV
jgi:pimeloyl-ACP methyl ester carboxylesterase